MNLSLKAKNRRPLCSTVTTKVSFTCFPSVPPPVPPATIVTKERLQNAICPDDGIAIPARDPCIRICKITILIVGTVVTFKLAKKILNLCQVLRIPLRCKKRRKLSRDPVRRTLSDDVFLTFPSRHRRGVDFRLMPWPVKSRFTASRMFFDSIIPPAALAATPMMPGILLRSIHTFYTPPLRLYSSR